MFKIPFWYKTHYCSIYDGPDELVSLSIYIYIQFFSPVILLLVLMISFCTGFDIMARYQLRNNNNNNNNIK